MSKTFRHEKQSLKIETANITADKIVSEGDCIMYTGNVSIKTPSFTARKARKAILDRGTNHISIWGGKELHINRKTICEDVGLPEDRVDYDLGSGVVRVYL
ncbi:hypothetical protein [Dyadobacter sp. MSC1_007]|uniref:hypothetical protein n=1 Tax=Dyadobacter sp. MSC1_007 TaxID=2909264 RepID=UPI00202EB32A|nr:hypothetical protein [Dyadobacter sp. MSC1_007]